MCDLAFFKFNCNSHCNLVTEDTVLIHLIIFVSVCVKVFAKYRHRSHEGSRVWTPTKLTLTSKDTGLSLEVFVLEHIPTSGFVDDVMFSDNGVMVRHVYF